MSKARRISLYTLNPFFYIQTRKLFLWYFLINCLVLIHLILIDYFPSVIIFENREDLEFIDPIYDNLSRLIVLIISLALLDKQATIRKINSQQIIGKLPNSYQWLPIIILASFKIVFSIGSYRVWNYPLSFIAPQWVEANLEHSIFSEAIESTVPPLCFILNITTNYILTEFLFILVFQGIILHRWAIKWGNTKAILIIGLLYGIISYSNFINGFLIGVISCLLYVKSKTLIVPLAFRIISRSIDLIVEAYYFFAIQSNSDNILQQFRSEFKLGMILSAISTPYLAWWLYKNWLKKNEELPYFANALSLEDKL